MRINIVGAFIRNAPFGTEIAFKKGFDRIGGHQITTVDPSYPDQKFDYGADATIVFKWIEGHYRDELSKVDGVKIVYQPDDLRFPHIKKMMVDMLGLCTHAFTFDQSGADLARSYGYTNAKRLLLTADNELYRHIPGVKKDIDFCFVGSLSNGENHRSRVKMVRTLAEKGFQVAIAHDLYDIEKIVEIYNRSKVVLNHATDVGQPFGSGYGYQCRHFEAGFTKACLLSNSIPDTDLKNFFVFGSEKELIDKANLLLSIANVRNMIAQSFYDELYKSHLPEHRALEIVDYLKGLT